MSTNTNTTMADELSPSQQTLMVNTHVQGTDLVSHAYSSDPPEKEMSSSDILQQALNEADGFDSSALAQSHEQIQHLTDHSYIHTTKSHDLSPAVDEMNTRDIDDDLEISIDKDNKTIENVEHFNTNKSIPIPSGDQLTPHPPFPEDVYPIDKSNDVLSMDVSDEVDVLDESALDGNLVISENTDSSPEKPEVTVSTSTPNQQYVFTFKDAPASTASGGFDISQLRLPPKKQTTSPLGSVRNPIQIIQNGNSYHSTQLLTQAQLQQISHVLQTQKVQNGGKSVMYDPATNTRIVCRVVHPAELQVNLKTILYVAFTV